MIFLIFLDVCTLQKEVLQDLLLSIIFKLPRFAATAMIMSIRKIKTQFSDSIETYAADYCPNLRAR